MLVVDDHHDGAEALGALLASLGCEVVLAYSGQQALELAPSFRPRLVILDLEMPGLDGFETARRMRLQDWARGSVFASHSGSAHPKIADISREAGFHHHIAKPAKFEAFAKILDALDDVPYSRNSPNAA